MTFLSLFYIIMLTTHKSFCSLPHTKLIINAEGSVSQCCLQKTQLGSILGDKTILDLWNSPLAKEIRQTTTNGRLHKVCTSWNACPFIVSERYMQEFQVHENFEYPTYMELCLPDKHCNIGGENPTENNPACIMCVRNYDFNKNQPSTDILCEKAKPIMPHLQHLCVLGVAEPFWKDIVFRVFDKLGFEDHKDHITFTTNTNVICLVEHTIERFFATVPKSDISFSLDAATPDTYRKIRRADAYDQVIKNIEIYMDYRDKHGGCKNHHVYIYNNINLLNVHEMTKMVETAYDLGIASMIMLPTHDQCGRVNMGELTLNGKNIKVFRKAAEDAKKRAEELGIDLHYSKPFDIIPPSVDKCGELQLVQLQVDL
jgi:hypothetical protein